MMFAVMTDISCRHFFASRAQPPGRTDRIETFKIFLVLAVVSFRMILSFMRAGN